MPDVVYHTCINCLNTNGFTNSGGSFICDNCFHEAVDLRHTAVDDEETYHRSSARRRTNAVDDEPIEPTSHHSSDAECTAYDDDIGTVRHSDLGCQAMELSQDDYSLRIRSRYLTGLQVMIELQCEALVGKFDVSPLVVGLVGPIWLRFLASTGVMDDNWADKVVLESEANVQEVEEFDPAANFHGEPVNIYGKRLVMMWYRSLSNRIPVSCSLAISFLVCHLAREAILPTDILKWTLEGKLPYLAAFLEIDKRLGPLSKASPINANHMFRPIQVISTQKLEADAATIAKRIGLHLPPVNFYAIASRYCRQLCLPSMKILLTASQIWEWSMASELHLSANEFRIPTRAFVMSILIVAVRTLYDINGYGFWESSLSNPISVSQCQSAAVCADEISALENFEPHSIATEVPDAKLNVEELLQILEAKYNELDDVYGYSNDLPSYLQYCKDVIFSGPLLDDPDEKRLLTELWEFYQQNKVTSTSGHQGVEFPESSLLNNKRARNGKSSDDKSNCRVKKTKATSQCSMEQRTTESLRDKSIRQMKLEMEENRFCYITPRTNVKRKDYLHYARRRKDKYVYAVHADYYILLCSCAKVAQVETRVMHTAVLIFEKRLKWMEKKMGDSLCIKHTLDDYCDFCLDEA